MGCLTNMRDALHSHWESAAEVQERRSTASVRHSSSIASKGQRSHRATAGETMVETLVSMLIIVLVFGFLVNAILAAAHINAQAREEGKSVDMTNVSPGASNSVQVSIQDTTSGVAVPAQANIDAQLYEVKDSEGQTRYYYYEYETS